jgi:COP9 signalosome complex subunit 3
MESQQYDAVLPIIDSTILYIPGASDKPTPKYLCSMALSPVAYITLQSGFSTKQIKSVDLLEYFLLSGMVYIGLRRWQRARECLELAVTYPSRENGCSILMSEAYKKWILIRVLLDGKAPTLPKHISTNLAKSLHTLAKPYETVAQIFEQGTASRLKSELEAGRGIWTTDCNVGLVMCVMAAYQQFQIRNLANVHTKLTMVDIHNLTQSAELGSKLPNVTAVETLISSMIADGTLHATLSHPPNQSPVLTFSQSGPLLSEKQTQAALAVSTSRLKSLTDEIKATDRMMTYEKEYVKYAQKVKKTLAMDQAVGVNEVEWSGIDDEDLMGSLY